MNHLQQSKNGVTINMKFDPDKYRHAIAELKLSKEQEDELLLALWDIMRMFAELGHGVNSINTFFPDVFKKDKQDSGNMTH